jgi:hypothetical protein
MDLGIDRAASGTQAVNCLSKITNGAPRKEGMPVRQCDIHQVEWGRMGLASWAIMGAADSESIRKVLNLPRSLRSGPVQ